VGQAERKQATQKRAEMYLLQNVSKSHNTPTVSSVPSRFATEQKQGQNRPWKKLDLACGCNELERILKEAIAA
jgi:hypothetical protein